MRHLSAALACEGRTDFKFLAPLLGRVLEEAAMTIEGMVDIGDLVPVLSGTGQINPGAHTNQKDEVTAAFSMGHVSAEILFVHADASGDIESCRKNHVEPVERALKDKSLEPLVCGVLPDREIEAWMLADTDSLAWLWSTGVDLSRSVLPPGRVGEISDPKQKLWELAESVDTGRGRRRPVRRRGGRVDQAYDNLGLEIDLDQLRCVPSFCDMESRLKSLVRQIGNADG